MEEIAMPESASVNPSQTLPASHFPICTRCNKPVNRLTISTIHNYPNKVIIDYECHGENARQEVDAALLSKEQGLASYTVFNDYTSGLLKSTAQQPS
jgi:hypothetical protein